MADEISDPEARGVAERAYQTLVRVGAEGQLDAPKPASKTVSTLFHFVGASSSSLCRWNGAFSRYRIILPKRSDMNAAFARRSFL